MSRSLKKGPFIHYKLEQRVLEAQASGKKTTIKTWSPSPFTTATNSSPFTLPKI